MIQREKGDSFDLDVFLLLEAEIIRLEKSDMIALEFLKIRVDTQKIDPAQSGSTLFSRLTPDSLFECLSPFDASAGQKPALFIPVPDEQHPSVADQDDPNAQGDRS